MEPERVTACKTEGHIIQVKGTENLTEKRKAGVLFECEIDLQCTTPY